MDSKLKLNPPELQELARRKLVHEESSGRYEPGYYALTK